MHACACVMRVCFFYVVRVNERVGAGCLFRTTLSHTSSSSETIVYRTQSLNYCPHLEPVPDASVGAIALRPGELLRRELHECYDVLFACCLPPKQKHIEKPMVLFAS